MNDITEEDLVEIKNLAALFYVPKEVALMLEIDRTAFVEAVESEEGKIYEAFQTGRLQSETDLRSSIIKLSKAGSSPAQTMAMDLLNKSKSKMFDR